MKIILPSSPTVFLWTADAVPPAIPLSTDGNGPHEWSWKLVWKSYTASGSASTEAHQWDATVAAAAGGGTLTVTAKCGGESAVGTINIGGTNPTLDQVTAYLATQPNGADFAKILQHESKATHFSKVGIPIESFDHGFGMCQLTTPVPTFLQVWNWKTNVLGGLALFNSKRNEATKYLSQGGRSFTPDQLLRETICRWNGGSYHEWTANGWARKRTVLCDSKTGNIGWDMTDPSNQGKTEAQLRLRDSAQYSAGRKPGMHWMYSGICYADSILG